MAHLPHLVRVCAIIPVKTEAGGRGARKELIGNFREVPLIVVPEKERNIEARKRAGELALGAVRIAARFPDLGSTRLVLRREIVDFYPFGRIGIAPFTEVISVALIAPRLQKAPVALHRRPFKALRRRPRGCDDFKAFTL